MSIRMEEFIHEKAMKFVKRFEEKKGWKPRDVSHNKSVIGYDILSARVVGNLPSKKKPNAKPILYIIDRDDIERKYLSIKRTIHFSSTFQKQLPKKYRA